MRIVAEYEASGLSGCAFSAQHGFGTVDVSPLPEMIWESQAGIEDRWLAVEVSEPKPEPSTDSKLSVLLPCGRRIEVHHDFDAVTLKQLIHVLKSA